ncbi:MAG: serine hydrolase [Planctomycetota bacterium]|nr:serine hydrolase [Planctomycetota bacterium]
MRRFPCVPILALPLLLLLAGPAAAEPPVATPLGERVDRAVQQATEGGFWGGVAVARGGKSDLIKGYGFADYAGRPVGPDTLFELASVSKQVTATAILRLVQQGKLALDDTLATFWPKVPADKHDITVGHLLHHRAGLDSSLGVPYDSPLDRTAYVAHILQAPRTHVPGDHFSYSNVGYALLAAIVEERAKTSFEQYCREQLFKPAKLTRTGFIGEQRLLNDSDVAGRFGADKDHTAVNWHYGFGYRGMGGVVTTLNDMLLWDRALRGDRVLDAKHRALLYDAEGGEYACGWMVEPTPRGTTKVHHSGGVKGFGIWVTRFLEEDAVIAIFTNNRKDLYDLVKRVEDIVFPPPRLTATVDVSGLPLSPYSAFESAEGCTWVVAKDEAGKVLRMMNGQRVIVEITMPAGYERKVIAGLRQAAEARRHDDKGGKAAMDVGVYLNAYGGKPRLELTEQLEIQVLPQYQGSGPNGPIVDKRPVLILQDGVVRNWTMMVKMNVAATHALIKALE